MTTSSSPARPEFDDQQLEPHGHTGEADPRRWQALMVIAAATLMVVLDASIVNLALPQAQRDLNISDVDRQWVLTAYTLALGGLLLLGGRVADVVGRKKVFLIGLVGFAAASALGGAAQNAAMLFAARGLQGVFAALLAPAALSLIAVTFVEPSERARAFGVYGAVAGAGGALGLVLGGLLTEYGSWRWCLLVNVPIAVVAVLAALPTVRESRSDGDRRYDLPGAALATGGLVALVAGFTAAAREGGGWLAPSTLGLLGLGLVLLVTFVAVEARTPSPLLPLRVVTDRNRGGALLGSLLLAAGMFAMFLFLAYYFQVNLDYSPVRAGLAILPFSAGIIISSAVASSLLPRFGPKPLLVGGMALATVGLFWLATLNASSTWASTVLPAEVVMSIGLGLVFVPLSSVALFGVAANDTGVASALLNTTQQIGGALGVALLNTLYTSAVASYLTAHPGTGPGQLDAFLRGYRTAFLAGGGLFAAALLVFLVMVNARRDPAVTGPDATPAER